jgi:hypothetical protein
MDARYLSQPDRDAFKRIVCARRDEIGTLIKRMENRHWFTDDGALQNLRAAWHSLHAAVQALRETDGKPVKRYEPGPKYTM